MTKQLLANCYIHLTCSYRMSLI